MKALVFENDPSCPLARVEGPMASRGISAEIGSEVRKADAPEGPAR